MNRFLASVIVGAMVLGLASCSGDVSVTSDTEEDFERDYIIDVSELNYDYEPGEFATVYKHSEYTLDSPILDDFIGYWTGDVTPPMVWYLFTHNGNFYTAIDADTPRRGTFLVHDSGLIWLTYEDGEQEELFLLNDNFLAYEATEGLNRITEDDSVPNWVVEEIEAHRSDEEEVPVDYELNAQIAGMYEWTGLFNCNLVIYENGECEWYSDGGAFRTYTYTYDGTTIVATPVDEGDVEEFTVEEVDGVILLTDTYGDQYQWIGNAD